MSEHFRVFSHTDQSDGHKGNPGAETRGPVKVPFFKFFKFQIRHSSIFVLLHRTTDSGWDRQSLFYMWDIRDKHLFHIYRDSVEPHVLCVMSRVVTLVRLQTCVFPHVLWHHHTQLPLPGLSQHQSSNMRAVLQTVIEALMEAFPLARSSRFSSCVTFMLVGNDMSFVMKSLIRK